MKENIPVQVNDDVYKNLCGQNQFNYYSSCINQDISTSTCKPLLILVNLPYEFTELSVYKLCSKFGSIHDVKVFIEDQICFCTVEMSTKQEIINAASHLNGLVLSKFKPITAIVL